MALSLVDSMVVDITEAVRSMFYDYKLKPNYDKFNF